MLADLHGGGDIQNDLVVFEYEEIKQQVFRLTKLYPQRFDRFPQVYFERTEGAKSYLDLLKPGNPRRVLLGCSLQMWSQLTGMNVMM